MEKQSGCTKQECVLANSNHFLSLYNPQSDWLLWVTFPAHPSCHLCGLWNNPQSAGIRIWSAGDTGAWADQFVGCYGDVIPAKKSPQELYQVAKEEERAQITQN